jgi:quinol monooxygenase YgiN
MKKTLTKILLITLLGITIVSFTHQQFVKMENQKISILLRFKAKKGQTQALANHLVETANKLTPNELGTEIFTVSTTPIDPEAVYVYEVYTNAEAKILHETGDVYKAARDKTNEFVDGAPQVVPLIPIGGKGLK